MLSIEVKVSEGHSVTLTLEEARVMLRELKSLLEPVYVNPFPMYGSVRSLGDWYCQAGYSVCVCGDDGRRSDSVMTTKKSGKWFHVQLSDIVSYYQRQLDYENLRFKCLKAELSMTKAGMEASYRRNGLESLLEPHIRRHDANKSQLEAAMKYAPVDGWDLCPDEFREFVRDRDFAMEVIADLKSKWPALNLSEHQ